MTLPLASTPSCGDAPPAWMDAAALQPTLAVERLARTAPLPEVQTATALPAESIATRGGQPAEPSPGSRRVGVPQPEPCVKRFAQMPEPNWKTATAFPAASTAMSGSLPRAEGSLLT